MDNLVAERKLKDARKALGILADAGFPAMLAGGCVRDRLLGLAPKDYDVATAATPDLAAKAFSAKGIKVVPTGVDHGTITVVMRSGPVEVTSLRVDVASDGRHAQVAFGTSFADDAARRDFTINSLFEDAAGKVHDFCGGRADLAARTLRFVGEPTARIREDYLRILRFFRFFARLGFAPDPAALAAIAAERRGLARLSQERVTSEILQTVAAPHAANALRAMADAGVWALILPELGAVPAEVSGARPALTAVALDWRPLAELALLALAAPVQGVDFAAVAERLKLSRADAKIFEQANAGFAALANLPARSSAIMDFLDAAEGAGGEGSLEGFYFPLWAALLAYRPDSRGATLAAVERLEASASAVRRAKLPLTGNDLLAERPGLQGKELGAALAALKQAYRDGEWATRAEGLKWLAAFSR